MYRRNGITDLWKFLTGESDIRRETILPQTPQHQF
jgi:hypothetical protein